MAHPEGGKASPQAAPQESILKLALYACLDCMAAVVRCFLFIGSVVLQSIQQCVHPVKEMFATCSDRLHPLKTPYGAKQLPAELLSCRVRRYGTYGASEEPRGRFHPV
mmetsp:Transcript_60323/g.140971  ORF Transcript_60323/g.140971 Transcript_60323/m.140971 type:complete len:108 (-) Transcript_60323:69-392(-)